MMLIQLMAIPLWGLCASAYLVSPPGTAFPGADSDCSAWIAATSGMTCADIEASAGITEAQFEDWNPEILKLYTTCTLKAGFDYCVQVDYGTSSVTSASSTSTTIASTSASITSTTFVTTTSGDGISTPSPIQTGMVSTCDEFHLVVSGDTCEVIAEDAGISLATFYAWNPAVGSSCESLGLGDYVCIDIIGYTVTTSSASVTTTTSDDGVSTPSPIQTGMVSTCDKFYLVVSGDTCAVIAEDAGISLATFYAWNPAVGSSCESLGLGDYVCVDIIGYTVTTSSASVTTTTSDDGVSTPSPIQTGMVSTCDEFHLVVSGDTCYDIAQAAGISLDTFYAWNPAVGSSCESLGLGDYVCIDIIGYTATATSTSSATKTSSAGNGVTTPTNYETGMVTDCDKFYLVKSGDTCASIASAEGVTTAEIEEWNPTVGSSCSGLWLNYYICVGIL